MKKTLIILLSIFLSGCVDTERQPNKKPEAAKTLTTAEAIAQKHGVAYWNNISEFRFTFNIDRGENHFERSFIWNPKTQDVTYISEKDTVAYNRNETLDSLSIRADQRFINDSYWLLSPFKMVWDTGTTISEEKNQVAPISKDTLNKLTIVYGSEGGYTPGDAYDFFYNDNLVIKEWVFRKGNAPEPSMLTTFEDLKTMGDMQLYTMHKDSTANFQLYFTKISAK